MNTIKYAVVGIKKSEPCAEFYDSERDALDAAKEAWDYMVERDDSDLYEEFYVAKAELDEQGAVSEFEIIKRYK